MVDILYLDDERKKLWEKLVEQDKQINKLQDNYLRDLQKITASIESFSTPLPQDIKDAKQASKETAEFRNKAKKRKTEIDQMLESLNESYTNFKNLLDDNIESKKSINAQWKSLEQKEQQILQMQTTIEATNEQLKPLIAAINQSTSTLIEITNLRNSIKEKQEESLETQKKIENLLEISTKQKVEITKLKNQIIGYTQKDTQTGEEIQIEGLKQELEGAFDDIKDSFISSKEEMLNFQNTKTDEVNNFIVNMQKKYEDLIHNIESLLPKAMTAGLSSAYQAKREAEETERKNAYRTFRSAIGLLLLISLLPVALTCHMFLNLHFDIQTIINDTPKIMSAILAIYAPAFWLAYSANKRMNLSKRLIEEYTYKESLSKTFEGLSKQIEDIENEDIANDLKSKLLYIIVSMNSENPGKLIKGYNKPDHPIMDIINNSIKLTESIQNIAQMPILGKICSPIINAIEEQKELQSKKIDLGFRANKIIGKSAKIEDDSNDDN